MDANVSADRSIDGEPSNGTTRLVYGASVAAALVVVGCSALLAAIAGVDGRVISQEPQITLGGRLFTGALSNLGALVWMVGVVLAAVGASMARSDRERLAFGAGSVIGALLLIDDFFLIHDFLNTVHSELDTVLLSGYGLFIAVMLVRFRTELGPLGVAGLGAALGLFMVSAGLDTLFNQLDQLIEDGVKFVGIAVWSTTWVLLARPWARAGTG